MATRKPAKVPGSVIGRNVTVQLEGDVIVIRIDGTLQGETSKSGKSSVVGTTNGNVGIPGTDLICGLNVYRRI